MCVLHVYVCVCIQYTRRCVRLCVCVARCFGDHVSQELSGVPTKAHSEGTGTPLALEPSVENVLPGRFPFNQPIPVLIVE